MIYGVTYQESTDSNRDLLNATYEHPEVSRSSSMVYKAAYQTNHCSTRHRCFRADYQDTSEAVSEIST